MSETTKPSGARAADYLEQASRAAADWERQSAQMFQRMASQQDALQRSTDILARRMLRSLGQAEARSRRVSDELERLARRAATLATRQLLSAERQSSLPARLGASAAARASGAGRSERQNTALWSRLVSSGLRAL